MRIEFTAHGDVAVVMQVIRTTLTRRGRGVEGDPIRVIEQFWSLDGKLLAENDSWRDGGVGAAAGTEAK